MVTLASPYAKMATGAPCRRYLKLRDECRVSNQKKEEDRLLEIDDYDPENKLWWFHWAKPDPQKEWRASVGRFFQLSENFNQTRTLLPPEFVKKLDDEEYRYSKYCLEDVSGNN